ncbi:tetratricopeptide repeat protein [Prosthecobacter vanneervenii]|uniref:Tetratricopeptide (TPR) repeat protein n=1 Tax=Prosthecobacter vanneervenii TaxID=48466 RepID=A0A7W8DLF2_9BACT|nr:hypothetical protein [Prosthecobacter vanneervenii]MBB5034248.1 tetratricopeptide (TPR) repeat protein [Prosthecobacter vanneervenii]
MKPLLGIFILTASLTAKAEEYMGAAAVLKLLAEKTQAQPAAEKKADPVEELRLMVKAMRTEAASLAPAEAAKRWLALLDAYLTIPAEQLYSNRAYEDRLSMATIIMALPPPAAWEEIRTQLEKRKGAKPLQNEALRLLAAALLGNTAAEKECLERMRKEVASLKKLEDYQRENYLENIENIAETLQTLTGSPAEKAASFEKSLSQLEKGDDTYRQRHGSNLNIPDLVKLVGEKHAEELLIRVLKFGPDAIEIDGTATQKLAASLALKHIGLLKKPLWELVHSLDDAALYEALKKKFSQKDRQGNQHHAERIYLVALIADGRTEDATRLILEEAGRRDDGSGLQLDVDDLDALGRQGLGAKVLGFLKQLLSKDPGIPCWRQFIELSARQNASAAALELMDKSLATPGLSAGVKSQIQSHRYLALLAADKREEGVQVLRELVNAGPQGGASDGKAQAQEVRQRWEQLGVHVTEAMLSRFQQEARGGDSRGLDEYIRLCGKLAALGQLLGKPELIEEGLSKANATYETLPDNDPNGPSFADSLVDLLLDHQRGPKAESVLANQIVRMLGADKPQRGRVRLDSQLTQLAAIYDQGGRHADVLALLEQSPYWGAPDLAAFESNNSGKTPLLLIAARALDGAGRADDARRVVSRALQDYPATDGVYELLLKVGAKQPLEELLDEMAKRDRFEERPLIWKARVQLNAGKLDEAEKTVRAAIAIDPSDGEQGKGDRMRAYAVLAEVLEKKGDADTAKIMRGAVSAIRKSEAADDWWQAGLLSEAVRRYEAALLDFADAYCIQSRLALRYSEVGDMARAEQHYLRAFELMPESFGRVESHCFGCEGAFKNHQAQNAADKVFTRLAATPPVKAQVYYLLGYLRESQDRSADAAEAYRQAVKTDPDYLNAWKELSSLSETSGIADEERENAALQIFRLDPAGRHSGPDLNRLHDLRRLWGALLDAEKNQPPTETGPLLPLTAAKAKIEAQKTTAAGGANPWDTWSYPTLFSRRNDTRQHLTEHHLINVLTNFVDSLSRM